MIKCPECGTQVMESAVQTTRTLMRPLFQLGDHAQKHWFTPTMQAVTGGAIAASGAGFAALIPVTPPVGIAGTVGSVVCACILAWSYRDNAQRAWYELENRFGLDLDGDGHIGDPAHVQSNGNKTNYLPIKGPVKSTGKYSRDDRLHLEMVARFVEQCEIIGTSVSAWVGGGRIEQEQYYELRSVLIKAGWAAWNNPEHKTLGWSLLYPAQDIKNRIMEGVAPTPPAQVE